MIFIQVNVYLYFPFVSKRRSRCYTMFCTVLQLYIHTDCRSNCLGRYRTTKVRKRQTIGCYGPHFEIVCKPWRNNSHGSKGERSTGKIQQNENQEYVSKYDFYRTISLTMHVHITNGVVWDPFYWNTMWRFNFAKYKLHLIRLKITLHGQ